MSERIYLDNAATTRLLPAAWEAMREAAFDRFANPSSVHEAGSEVEALVEENRAALARVLGCRPSEIVFTSGGTEADNLALFGTALASRKRKLVISAIEHPAVLEAARELQRRGFDLALVPVDESGLVEPDRLLDQVDDETFLVSVIHGNNEIGTLQPLDELARAVKSRFPCCLFHTDAVQSFGHVPLSLAGSGIDLLSLSAHKLHGPKGVGALVVREGTRLRPLIYGGSQESDRRAGTLNVPGIVGMTAAARFMGEHLDSHARHLESVVGALRTRLEAELPDLRFNGHPSRRLPGLLSVSVPGVKSQNLMLFLEAEGVIVSAGAACKSTSSKQSHVLEAIGQRPDHATIRLSASFETTLDEAQAAADRLVATVRRLRK